MAKLGLKNMLQRGVAQTKLFTSKNMPEILLVGGIVGIVVSEIGIAIQATKVPKINKTAKKKLEQIREGIIETNVIDEDGSVETCISEVIDERRELTKVYAQTSLEYVKLFGPFVLTTAASFWAFIKSYSEMKERNVQLAAAYAILDRSFKEYRKRVIDKFGAEEEKNIRYNIKERLEDTLDEDGNKIGSKVTETSGEYPIDNSFSFWFKDGVIGWSRNSTYNRDHLFHKEKYWNQMLCVNGYVTINDIRKDFGLKPTKAGAMWGWLKEKNGTQPTTVISFGLANGTEPNNDFLNGDSPDCFIELEGPVYIFDDFSGSISEAQKKIVPNRVTLQQDVDSKGVTKYN